MRLTKLEKDSSDFRLPNPQVYVQPDGHASLGAFDGPLLDLSSLRHQSKDQLHEILLRLSEQGHQYVKNGDSMIVYLNNPSTRESIEDNEERLSKKGKDTEDIVLEKYHPLYCRDNESLPTHLYDLLATVLRRVADGEKQQVLFTAGISGAGKTYTSEVILNFLLHQFGDSPSDFELKSKAAAALSILASLCNASTPLNSESSRASVIATAIFDQNTCRPLGVSFSIMAWERSRVMTPCGGQTGHSNFLFLEGLAAWGYEDQDMATMLKLDGKFPITSHEINSSGWQKACDHFQSYHQALSILFSPNEVVDILKVSAGILHLSRANAAMKESPTKFASLRIASELIGIPIEALDAAIHSVAEHNNESLPTMCEKVGQCLAHQLLKRVLSGINRRISADDHEGDHRRVMIVDQAGFEEFSKNELAQFGVNMINEHFQHCLHVYLTQINLPLSERSGKAYASSSAADTSSLRATMALESDIFQATCALAADSKAAGTTIAGIDEGKHTTLKHFAGSVMYDTSKFIKQNMCIRTEEVMNLVARSALDTWRLDRQSREEQSFAIEDLAWDFALSRAASVQDFVEELFRCSDRCYFIRCFSITRKDSQDTTADAALIQDQIRTSGLAAAVSLVPVYENAYSPEQIISKFPAIFSVPASAEIETIRSAIFNFVLSQGNLHVMDFQIDENRIRLNERMMKAMHIFQEKVSVAGLEDVTKSATSDWDETSEDDPNDLRIGDYSMMVDDKDAFLTLGVKLEDALAKQSEQLQSIVSMERERLRILDDLSIADRKAEDLRLISTHLESEMNQMNLTLSEERTNMALTLKEKDREFQKLMEVVKVKDGELRISASDFNRIQLESNSLQRELQTVEADTHAKSITIEASQKDLRHALDLVEAESASVQRSKGKIDQLLIERTRAEEAGAAFVNSSVLIVTYNKADLNACIRRQRTALSQWYLSLSDKKGKPIRVVLSGLRNFVKTGSLINQVLPMVAVLEGWVGLLGIEEEDVSVSQVEYTKSQVTIIIQDARDRCTAELPKILFRTSTVSGGKIRKERLDPSALVKDRRMWDKAGNLAAEDVMRTLEDVWAYIHPINNAIDLLHPAMANYMEQIYIYRKDFPMLKIGFLASKIRVLSANFGEEYKTAAADWANILTMGVDGEGRATR